MNIFCIYSVEDFSTPEKPLMSGASVPFGIAYIATVLKKQNHDVDLFVLTKESKTDQILADYIQKKRPSLCCLTAVTTQFPFICEIAKKVKQIDPNIVVILGGHHATLYPENAISPKEIDAICIGEGENAIVELSKRIETKSKINSIHNLWIKDPITGEIEKNERDSFIQDLDALPIIDRKMWQPWINDLDRMTSILVGRGCPFQCAYCSNHILSKISHGKYVRFRSPQNIILEIEEIIKDNPKLDRIYLEVETLSVNLAYTYDLLDQLKAFNENRKNKIIFGCNFSISGKVKGNEELLIKLKEANFEFINIGLESGSPRIRNDILHRPEYTNEDIVNFCELAKKYQIQINVFVIIGFPKETMEDYRQTVECIRQCKPQSVYLSIFYPYPGTKLYSLVKEMGLLKNDIVDVSLERKMARINFPDFSKNRIQLEYWLFYYKVYKGVWPFSKLLLTTIRQFIGSNYTLNKTYRLIVGSQVLRKKIRALQKKFNATSN